MALSRDYSKLELPLFSMGSIQCVLKSPAIPFCNHSIVVRQEISWVTLYRVYKKKVIVLWSVSLRRSIFNIHK